MRSGLGPMMHQWPQVGPTQKRQLRQEEGHGGCRPRSAEVTRWPHGEAALSTGLTAQPLKSHPEQGCPRFPGSSLPFQVRPHGPVCEQHFLPSRSHLPTPLHPVSDTQVLVAFSLLANNARSLHLSPRHTQPVQGLWDPWHPPLLEYKSLINNKRPLSRALPPPTAKTQVLVGK